MNDERILAHKNSEKLTSEEIETLLAGGTGSATGTSSTVVTGPPGTDISITFDS